ncbi:Cytochrome P450, E-class, group I [Parasponia andersonii]|uniref:Cytochrome P450, E-class, group I n=1 Tax=Parasponia andersonii TaxID=3476 RepID=A0A2P5B3T5_PARAD|nr:Cytochrome P450, E-class, group I [Parasponia andersonii]
MVSIGGSSERFARKKRTARVHSFKPIREDELFNLMDWIASNVGSVINLTERIRTSMYGVISRAASGKKSRDHDEFILIVEEAVEVSMGFELADFFPSFSFHAKISPARPKLERLQRRAARIIENIIKDHKENKSLQKSGASGTDEDLLDVLLKYHNNSDNGISLTGDNLKAFRMKPIDDDFQDIFGVWSETSATTVEWTMSEMIRNPIVMKKAQDELLKRLLRLHPPVPLLVPRECREKCGINGYEIPAKTRIIVNAWAIGRDTRYWTELESFIPERFLDSSIDFKGNYFQFIQFRVEGEYVQACCSVSSMLSFSLHCYCTILIGNSPVE